MQTYQISYSSGVTHFPRLKSDRVARVYATKYLAYGSDVIIYAGNAVVGTKSFWSNLTRFGWDRWQ